MAFSSESMGKEGRRNMQSFLVTLHWQLTFTYSVLMAHHNPIMLFAFGVVSKSDAYTLVLSPELRNAEMVIMLYVCALQKTIYFVRIQGMRVCSCPVQYEPDFWISVDSLPSKNDLRVRFRYKMLQNAYNYKNIKNS